MAAGQRRHYFFSGYGEVYHLAEYPRHRLQGRCGCEIKWPPRLTIYEGEMEKLGLRPCKRCLRSMEGE